MASSASTSEARELALVERVEFRIALADTEDKLEALLKTYLAPLLLKLASEHLKVRNKVISVCQHISTRIKVNTIQLPVASLLKQFKDYPKVPLIQHFDLIYIQQGITRLPITERLTLFPVLINDIASIASNSPIHGAQLLHFLLRVLKYFILPPRGTKEDEALRATLSVTDEDAKFLSFWFGKIILLTIAQGDTDGSRTNTCPGLSISEYQFLTLHGKGDAWNPSAESGLGLLETKVAIVKFLASGTFTDRERIIPAVLASADRNPRVSELGEDILKRTLPNLSLEDSGMMQNLFQLYLGSRTSEGPLPVSPAVKTKLLTLLSRSRASTAFPSQISTIVQEDLAVHDGEGSARGREALKLRSGIFSYVNFFARHGSKEHLGTVAPILIQILQGFIEDQGWPLAQQGEDISLRRYAYEVIGLLSKAAPETVLEESLTLLRWFFRSLAMDVSGKEVSVSIEESLSNILVVFTTKLNPQIERSLREVLLENIQSPAGSLSQEVSKYSRSTYYTALRFANRCLSYTDVVGRWIDICAVALGSTERQEVIEEASRGLDPYWFQMLNGNDPAKIQFPPFSKLTHYVFCNGETSTIAATPEDVIQRISKFKTVHLAKVLPSVEICLRVLLAHALAAHGILIGIDIDWARKLHTAIRIDIAPRRAVRNLIKEKSSDISFGSAFQILLRAAFEGSLIDDTSASLECGELFVCLVSLSPDEVLARSSVVQDFQLLEQCLFSNNHHRRAIAARAYGLLASHPSCPPSQLLQSTTRLFNYVQSWKEAVGSQVNNTCGATQALGFSISREAYRASKSTSIYSSPGGALEATHPSLYHNLISFLGILCDILNDSTDPSLKESTYVALGQLSSFFAISLPMVESLVPFPAAIDQIYASARKGGESAIYCLGRLSMIAHEEITGPQSNIGLTSTSIPPPPPNLPSGRGNNDNSNLIRPSHFTHSGPGNPKSDITNYPGLDFQSELLPTLEDKLFKLHEIRETEVQFAVGEALTALACGWESSLLPPILDVEGSLPKGPIRTSTLSRVAKRIIDGCKSTKPTLKKASVIWLLSLTQFCGHLPSFQKRFRSCQAAFMQCLNDRSEIVQEVSSRGLGLLYEIGDQQLKSELIRDLVNAFSGNKSHTPGTITSETQLFEPGAVPASNGSVTTYKDILNLASEAGDSSLVYRLMSLAANNSIWSSRAAFGRFGLSRVFSDASVDGYLSENSKLYPKLYRYRFDPNPNVQRSMNDIWNALVKSSNETLDTHFDDILQDLLNNILGKEWRVRQACCAAIADLLQGRKLERYEKHLSRIWTLCFKVLDDIKGTVRLSAASLARVLTGILTKNLEAGESSTKSAEAMLKQVIPFLLSTSGIESNAAEVQSFALLALLDIIKKSKPKTICPHVPELIERMVGLLSSLEPEAINYIHLNASKYNLTEQEIDEKRLQSIRASPLMDAIERCLDKLDEASMTELVPFMENAMKAAVGLPSKVGCSRILVSLATRHLFLFRPHADQFLRLITKYINDRNETVTASYAFSAGYVARAASDKEILRTVDWAKQIYFTLEDDRHRVTSGDVIFAISKHAPDRFMALSADILPFVFYAKHDSHDHARERFQETWNDNVAGLRAIRLHLKEIVALSRAQLESNRWVLKHTAARTIADAIFALTSPGENLNLEDAGILWPVLERAIGGKTWEGKEVVLRAFIKFAEEGAASYEAQPDIARQILKIAVREAKRQNATYRQYSLRALGQIVATRDDIDTYQLVNDIVGMAVEELTAPDSDPMNVDEPTVVADKIRDQTLIAAVESLVDTVNKVFLGHPNRVERLLSILRSIETAMKHLIAFQPSFFGALSRLFKKLSDSRENQFAGKETESKARVNSIIFNPMYEAMHEKLRLGRAQMLANFALVEPRELVDAILKGKLEGEIAMEKSPAVRQVLEKVRNRDLTLS